MNATRTDSEGLSSAARNLRWLLSSLVDEVPGARSVVVVSSDGLMLASSDVREAREADARRAESQAAEGDPERPRVPPARHDRPAGSATPAGSVAALSTVVSGIAGLTGGAARLMETGEVRQTVVTMENGHLFVMAISDGSLLGLHAASECDMNAVAFQMALFVGRAGHVLTPELRVELRRGMEG